MRQIHSTMATALVGAATLVGQAGAEPLNRGALEALFDEPVTLSATGAPQRVTDAPVNMTIISQEDIRRSGAIDLPGVLEQLANVDVMRTSAGQVDVSIRGYNSTLSPRLLVLVNGRQVYLDDFGRTNWNAIPVQFGEIRQIEVVSGPNTALFGFNAVAGVVNIITYDALQDDIDEVSVHGGSSSYVGGSGIWTARLAPNIGVRLSLGGFNAGALAGDDNAALAVGALSIEPRVRTSALSAAYAPTDTIRVDLEATWASSHRTDRYNGILFPSLDETNSFKIGIANDTDLGLWQAQLYSNNFVNLAFENQTTVGALSLMMKPAPAHTVRIAGEYRRNQLEQGLGVLSYDVQSLSSMWNWQASPTLALTSAARVDALQLERTGSFVSADFPFTNQDFDQAFTEWSFNIGAVYRVSERDVLRLSGARGIGSPSLLDYGSEIVFLTPPPGTTIYIAGDPINVAPTIVHNLELGWGHEAGAIGGRVQAAVFWQKNESLRVFASRQEVLAVAPTFVVAFFPEQIGASEMYGIELSADGESGRFHWDAQYSWRSIDDALTVSPLFVQANYERTSPEHVVTGRVAWIGEDVELGADARYTSETLQFGLADPMTGLFAQFPVDAYTQVNAHVAWDATDAVQIEVSGRNLLSSQTQTVGLTPVERSVYVTLRAGF